MDCLGRPLSDAVTVGGRTMQRIEIQLIVIIFVIFGIGWVIPSIMG